MSVDSIGNYGLGLVIGFPLCGGILTGKYFEGIPAYSRASLQGQQHLLDRITSHKGRTQQGQVRQLCKLASRLQCTASQLAIAWCLRTPFANSVLIGAATVDQLEENLGAIESYGWK